MGVNGTPLFELFNSNSNYVGEQCLVGSFAGAATSKSVTEAYKGILIPYRNRNVSVKAHGCLTARPTSRADAKAGLSDPRFRCD